MAFIQIKSDNDKLSYVLGKNPQSGMQIREIRRGRAFAWYTPENEKEYNVWFKDSETEVSYKSHPNEDFEHVNKTRYNSAVAVLNLISEFFQNTVKKQLPEDSEGYTTTLVINMLDVSSKRILRMTEYVEDFDVSVTELANKNFRVEISTKKTVRELLNFASIFCLYAAMKNDRDFFDLNAETIEKYLTCLDLIDPPYFVRYVFKLNILRARNKFDKYKKLMETSDNHKSIKMTYGDTGYARRDWVKGVLGELNKDIVDVGCGEGFYVFDLAKKLADGKTYHAIDIDPEMREIIAKKASKRKLEDKIKIYDLVHNFDTLKGKDVLFIEVMEHMPYEDALNTGKLLVGKEADRILITTPNSTFNKYYFLENEFRHDDHDFELTFEEFAEYINQIDPDGDYDVTFCQIGDVVDGESTTSGAILTRRAE